MIPKIIKLNKNNFHYKCGKYRWVVVSKYGSDVVHTFVEAIKFWFWHYDIPVKRCVRKYKKYDQNS